jgi:hypothetical protein
MQERRRMNEQDKAKVQQVLEFLEIISPKFGPLVYTETDRKRDEAIAALRQLLEQPEPEPDIFPDEAYEMGLERIAYYTTPPAQPAVALPIAQVRAMMANHHWIKPKDHPAYLCGVFDAETAHGITTPPAQPDDHGDILTIAYLDGVHTGKQIAKREWVGLTDEEIEACDCLHVLWMGDDDQELVGTKEFARAIIAKLREKNGGAAQPADQPDYEFHYRQLLEKYESLQSASKPAALVDLTDDEIHALWWADKDHGDEWLNVLSTVRAVLAKIKEKNGGNHG